MKKKIAVWIIVSLLTILILFIGFQRWLGINPAAESLTKNEAQELVENRYNGKVTDIRLSNGQYLIEMNRSQLLYQIKLDAQRGEVVSFLKKANNANAIEGNESENSTTEQESLIPKTEEEIKKIISSEITGELVLVKKISENGRSIYKAVVMENDQKTVLKVDAHSGKILSRKIEEKVSPSKILTEDDAAEIALKQVEGVIDGIDLETKDNLTYYLVEIETKDDREATIQIHSITGNVLSITWED